MENRISDHALEQVQAALDRLNADIAQANELRADLLNILNKYAIENVGITPSVVEDTPTEDWKGTHPYAGVDLTGARNLKERLLLIGKATDKPINLTQVTKYLVMEGYTKQPIQGYRPRVTNTLSELVEEQRFLRVDPGMYQYIPEHVSPKGPECHH